MLATVGDGAYKLLFVLHILGVVIGFGTVFLNGLYGAQAKSRRGGEGLAIVEATYSVGQAAEWFIYSIPITGIILILLSDDAYKFSQTWVSVSFLLYIVALGVVHGVHLPNIRRMRALMAELTAGPPAGAAGGGPPPQVAELQQRGQRAALLGGILDLIVVVVIVLMVWKPGYP